MFLLYDIVVALVLLLSIPVLIYRALVLKKVRRGIPERFGFISRDKLAAVAGKDVIWVHAVSVGETMAARPLLKALRREFPDAKIVLSHVTETGRSVAEKLPEADVCVYFPFDITYSVRRVIRLLKPVLVVVVETEIWPNFFRACREQDAKVVIANGRISDRSYPRYLKFRKLLAPVLANVSLFCAQSVVDAERLVTMGAEPARVKAVGNIKYDVPVAVPAAERVSELRGIFKVAADVPVFVAASTHAGEEEAVLDVTRTLLDEETSFLLILVPRHPERAPQVVEEARKRGFTPVLRSRLEAQDAPLVGGDLLIVDTIGELMNIFPLAEIVFVGGSLVPVGGHNILEPASVGKPSMFGPYMHNFRDIARFSLERGSGWQVQNAEELRDLLAALLADPQRRAEAGAQGLRLVSENAGATERHLQAIRGVMGSR